jgi:hypothetical protein
MQKPPRHERLHAAFDLAEKPRVPLAAQLLKATLVVWPRVGRDIVRCGRTSRDIFELAKRFG